MFHAIHGSGGTHNIRHLKYLKVPKCAKMWLSVLVLVVSCGVCDAFVSGHAIALWRMNNVNNVNTARLIPHAAKKDLQVIELDNQFTEFPDVVDLNQELEDEADDQHFIAYLQDEFNNLSTNGTLILDQSLI